MNILDAGSPLGGYHGRCLRIDLDASGWLTIELPERVLRQFLGGAGLGTWLLLQEDKATADPLSTAAPLIFVFSPLVGSPLTTSAKFAVVSKSPLTNRINDSLASSGFAIAGKKTGYDAITIVGRAAEPSVLVVDDGLMRLDPASEAWGLSCSETQEWLRTRYPGDAACAVIGPAGERLVRYATISHDGRHAGRGGSGAVMGSKNLKAIVVRGTQRCSWAEPDKLIVLAKDLSQRS